jgi:GT2 family glycosyltransferase
MPQSGAHREWEPSISVVIPTYRREQVLLDTLHHVAAQVRPGDEILVIDQTPQHESATEQALRRLVGTGVRWYRRDRPHICAAMNAGALLARGELLLFLDDDVVPAPSLLEAHRTALSGDGPPPATCGQVLQPWHDAPVQHVKDLAEGFDAAYDRPCDILALMAGNFAIRRETYLRLGGMDENFFGACYRLEAELSYRIFRRIGRKVRFVPEASIRHLHASGGTRAFGHKDTWSGMGGVVGDYYFAMRCLAPVAALGYCLRRVVRAPVNRQTLRRPWRIPSLFLREVVAWAWALRPLLTRRNNYVKELATYAIVEAAAEPAPALTLPGAP